MAGPRRAIARRPLYRAEFEQMKRATDDVMTLAKIREQRALTQRALGSKLGTSHLNVLRIEHERDLYLSTLAAYIVALGGRLEIRAVFPDQVIDLVLPPEPEPAAVED